VGFLSSLGKAFWRPPSFFFLLAHQGRGLLTNRVGAREGEGLITWWKKEDVARASVLLVDDYYITLKPSMPIIVHHTGFASKVQWAAPLFHTHRENDGGCAGPNPPDDSRIRCDLC
jgi:hypothetical protein